MTLSAQIRAAYDSAGEAWTAGPAKVYRALAAPVLGAAGDVRGRLVLDIGSGSGVIAEALAARGGRLVALDLSHGMLRRESARRPPAVVADVRALPLRSCSVDLVTASFVLNHLERPAAGLREIRRVLVPGGRVLATSFEGEADHPAKPVLDRVAGSYGYVAPEWYRSVKSATLPHLATAERFLSAADEAGIGHRRVEQVGVTLRLTPRELVDWRFGMAQLAPFVAGLGGAQREALLRDAELAVRSASAPVVMSVLLLEGRV